MFYFIPYYTLPMQLHYLPNLPTGTNTVALHHLFDAYYNCRANKRNTINAIAFEVNYEHNLVQLYHDINNGTYAIGKSIAFIVDKPVKREIFAADFRDRIVHQYLINVLNPYFETQFIHDSYGCRQGKGTHFGIARVDKFMCQCSLNYTAPCYVLKLDIQGCFMSINKDVLNTKLVAFIRTHYVHANAELIINLCQQVIYNNPTQQCVIKGKPTNWNTLPQSKSLFYSAPNCGLPIGNLTSQVFANYYMNTLDHYIKHTLNIRYYGRYVDDFVIMHHDKEYLKSLIPHLSNFLRTKLQLTLHPNKIYLQHYTKGVQFLGTIINPNRIYIANRTKNNFYQTIQQHNAVVRSRTPTLQEQQQCISSVNSYLGIMQHYNTYMLRKRMVVKNISAYWFNYAYVSGGMRKLVLKAKTHKKQA